MDNYDLVADEIQIYFDERKEHDNYRISFSYEKILKTTIRKKLMSMNWI